MYRLNFLIHETMALRPVGDAGILRLDQNLIWIRLRWLSQFVKSSFSSLNEFNSSLMH